MPFFKIRLPWKKPKSTVQNDLLKLYEHEVKIKSGITWNDVSEAHAAFKELAKNHKGVTWEWVADARRKFSKLRHADKDLKWADFIGKLVAEHFVRVEPRAAELPREIPARAEPAPSARQVITPTPEKKEAALKSIQKPMQGAQAIQEMPVEEAARRAGVGQEAFEILKKQVAETGRKFTNHEFAEGLREYNEKKPAIDLATYITQNIYVIRARLQKGGK